MASDFSIRHAAHIIKNGGIIAYPTDTIYGLGCDPYNQAAVERINQIKLRPQNKQFILLAGHINQVETMLDIDEGQRKVITGNTEPTSYIIDASADAPAWLVDERKQLTIRISSHSLVQKLCALLDHALISTSANISGASPAKNNLQIHLYFGSSIDKILATNKKLTARPSKIIRLKDNTIIRE